MSCNSCYTDYVCHCIPYDDVIIINTRLTPGDTITWVLTDKFDNDYSGEVQVESDGTVHIPVAGLPDGLLTQFGGVFKLRLQDGDCAPMTFPMTAMYDCIELTVKGGNHHKNTVGCVTQPDIS